MDNFAPPSAQSITDLLSHNARTPDRSFLVTGGPNPTTYAEQLLRSRRMAAALVRRGARRGDRVHIQLANSPAFYDLWFATALTGLVLVPTSPQLTSDEIAHVYGDAEPAISVVLTSAVAAARQAACRTHAPRVVDVADLCAEAGVCPPAPVAPAWPAEVSAILYTSGTTSHPKGVMVTGANYVAAGRAVAQQLSIGPDDRWLVALPLFHANAQYYCTMSALVAGASVALVPRFSASGWGRQARELDATLGSLFAAPIRMILTVPATPEDQQNKLRAVVYAQNLAAAQAREFEERYGTRLVQLYGMTETVLPPTMNPNDERRRWDSIGQALPGVEVRLVPEPDVPQQGVGEMWIRGEPGRTLAAGYWRDPAATGGTFAGSWLRTGDLARRDPDGFLYFVDRSKDMIKRAGENVSAGEVERVANDHAGVLECAAVGMPDPVRDEMILLVVARNPGAKLTADELLAWCKQRLSPHKVPSTVRFVDALPRTSVGKIRKESLRQTAAEESAP